MSGMFCECSPLIELNISNFNTNNATDMFCMFSGFSDRFQRKIKSLYKNIDEEAFY